jgi:hypothetical protein
MKQSSSFSDHLSAEEDLFASTKDIAGAEWIPAKSQFASQKVSPRPLIFNTLGLPTCESQNVLFMRHASFWCLQNHVSYYSAQLGRKKRPLWRGASSNIVRPCAH